MVRVTDSLFETPTLDDLGSSTIEHDIMRRRACANGWLVDRCPGQGLPSSSSVCARTWGIPRYCLRRDRRSWANCAIAPGTIAAPKGRIAGKDAPDLTAGLMDRSSRPPAPAVTAGS